MKEPYHVHWLNNPFDVSDVKRYPVTANQTIQSWLNDHGGIQRLNRMPTICVYQGRELLRSEYHQPIEDNVCFVTLPTGGKSGSDPLRLAAMLALTVYTGGLATAWQAAGWSTGAIVGAQAGIMMAGGMLINAVLPPPGLPHRAAPPQGSPTYSLQAQGNAARLGSPIPVNYGRMRIYPDYAAQPYSEYDANEQYLYQLLCIGQGQNQVTDIRLQDTPLSHFDDVSTEIVPPMQKVTLFHTAVVSAPEAGGQDLTEPITHGPYILNDTGTQITRVACDLVFPGGLVGVSKDSGDEYSVGVNLHVWVETVDQKGKPTGTLISVFNDTISGNTRTAIRRTLAKDVPAGRYQMTIERTTARPESHEVKNCQLGAMKGYLVDDNEYGDVTLLALRIRASATLSNSASRLVNVLNERLIPVWDAGKGWSQPTLTRNPAWAFADAIRSRYGGDFADREIDLNGLHYLAGLFDARNDYFDGRFDTNQSLWDALGKIGQVCRSGPVRQGNVLRLIRDQHQRTPSQLFGMANMRDFSLDFVMHEDRTADSVKITYWDEKRDYAQTTVLCQLPDDTADHPQDITLFGCTNYAQAWREGMYLAASNRERRQMVSWTTGMEGHIPTFGDLVWVNHDLLSADKQFGGTVAAVAGDVLTLSRDVALKGNHWYILIRNREGGPSPPIAIEAVDTHHVRLLDTLPYIETDPEKEPSHFVIGQGKNRVFPVKVTSITPEDIDQVMIAGCIESEFVHTADQGQLPAPPPPLQPITPGLSITDLRATQGGTVQKPVIYLSWAVAAGADRYQIEYRRSGQTEWQPTGNSLINHHEFTCEPGLITCRVAALAAVRGPWATIDVNAGGAFDKPGKVTPQMAEPFTGNALSIRWDKEPAAARYYLEVHSGGALRRNLYLDRTITRYQYHYQDARIDGAGRKLTIKIRAQNAEGINGNFGQLTATNPPPPVPNHVVIDAFMDSFTVRCDRNDSDDIKELRVYGSTSKNFRPSAANLLGISLSTQMPVNKKGTWYFRVAWVDQWGASGLNFSGEYKGTSSDLNFDDWFPVKEINIANDAISTPKLQANAVEAGNIAAKAVTAEKLNVNQLSAISANLGHAKAGTFETDAMGTNPRVVVTSDGNLPFWIGDGPVSATNGAMYYDKLGKKLYSRHMSATNLDCNGGNFDNVTVQGNIKSSIIRGSVIEGGMLIQSDIQITTPTEADRGAGTTRYLTVIMNREQTGTWTGSASVASSSALLIHSANYSAEGAIYYGNGAQKEHVFKQLIRYPKYTVHPTGEVYASARKNHTTYLEFVSSLHGGGEKINHRITVTPPYAKDRGGYITDPDDAPSPYSRRVNYPWGYLTIVNYVNIALIGSGSSGPSYSWSSYDRYWEFYITKVSFVINDYRAKNLFLRARSYSVGKIDIKDNMADYI